MVETRLKMGSSNSKKKVKQKGLMTQCKEKLGDESPPSPPRNLYSTLKSSILTLEFKAFLRKLDIATSPDPSNPDTSRVTSLQFVLDVRELMNLPERERKEFVWRMGEVYFTVPGEGLVLDNDVLWTRCSDVCRARKTGSEDLKWLEKARDSSLKELDELHVEFLENRAPAQLSILCLL